MVESIFLHCAKSGVHTVLNATFSVGCPGDSEADYYMTEDDHRLNEERSRLIAVQTDAQFSLYPLGTPDYMDTIYDIIGLAGRRAPSPREFIMRAGCRATRMMCSRRWSTPSSGRGQATALILC